MGCFPGMRAVEIRHAGKIATDGRCRGTGGAARLDEVGASRRGGPGTGDLRPAPGQALLTLAGRSAVESAAALGVHISTVHNWRGYFAHGGVAGLRRRTAPGRQATIGPHAGAIAASILSEDTRHDGGWTLGRLSAEIARRGGPAISPRWLSHQLRQRGLPSVARAIPSKAAKTKQQGGRAASVLPI